MASSHLGVEAALSRGLSVALFAPGWTLEALPEPRRNEAGWAAQDDVMWGPIEAAVAKYRCNQ